MIGLPNPPDERRMYARRIEEAFVERADIDRLLETYDRVGADRAYFIAGALFLAKKHAEINRRRKEQA